MTFRPLSETRQSGICGACRFWPTAQLWHGGQTRRGTSRWHQLRAGVSTGRISHCQFLHHVLAALTLFGFFGELCSYPHCGTVCRAITPGGLVDNFALDRAPAAHFDVAYVVQRTELLASLLLSADDVLRRSFLRLRQEGWLGMAGPLPRVCWYG